MHRKKFFLILIICFFGGAIYATSSLKKTEMTIDSEKLIVRNKKLGIKTAGDPVTELDVNGPVKIKSKGYVMKTVFASGGGALINWNNGSRCLLIIQDSTNVEVNFTNLTEASMSGHLVLLVEHRGTGLLTFNSGLTIKWPYGMTPSFTSTDGSFDMVSFYYYSGVYYGVVSHDFY
jgi:hypothetical protein